jgi:hypothetical protein
LPLFSHPSALPALDRRVTPQSRSSCSVSRCGCRLPHTPHLRVLPAFDLQVAPNLETNRRFQRFSSYGFPHNSISLIAPLNASRVSPFLHLPALPATDCRVAPTLVSFSASSASASGFPAASLFQMRLATQVQVAPVLHLPALPATDFRVTPNLSSSGLASGLSLRVSPAALSLGVG